MSLTQYVKAAEILFERPFRTSSGDRRIAWKPKSSPRSREAGAISHVSFKDELAAQIPRLRAFAASLCGSATHADDLVQEALLRAWGQFGEISARGKSA